MQTCFVWGQSAFFRKKGPKQFVHYRLGRIRTTHSPCGSCVYSSATVVKHLLCNVQVLDFLPRFLKNNACIAVPVQTAGKDVMISPLFFSASAKAAPLNINKVSNSLLNFGRKLIAPAMASGGAVGAPAGGSSFPPPAMPIRSTVEGPQHHHQHQHHHHQAQQQRMMKSESMPVQLGKGKGETCGSTATEGSFDVCLRKVLLLILY